MLRLYDYLPSQNCYKIRLLLSQLGQSYERRLVSIFEGESHTDEFLRLNPGGAVPVLELEDGSAIAESNAILCYLAEGTPYLPAERLARAKVLQWLFFEQDYIQPTVATLRHWTQTGKLERNAGAVPGRRNGGLRVLGALERHLATHDFLANGRYSIADIAVFAYGHRADEAGFDFAAYPSFTAWIGRVKAQPGYLDEHFTYAIDPHSGRDLP